MLVLTRKVGETIVIGDEIEIMVIAATAQRVRLGIKAPPEVSIRRSELKPHAQTTTQATQFSVSVY
jgi:carbon storage regulator